MTQTEIQSIKQRFGIIGNSPLLNNAIQRALQAAPTEMSVLIMGESGTGKESFSKIIHSLSPRKHNQFIAVNCGAIPEGTIYSELFGHEKGAFTGSTDMRKGYFEVTDGGTIFLDEIGEMPLDTQSMLLRVLENGEFIRMGSSKPRQTNVRVVAATNVDLLDAVKNKKFREDLYYRLSTIPIYIPPLRERGIDIELLFRKFSVDFAETYRVNPIKLTEDAKQILINFRFPGNIRQMRNIVYQISLLETDERLITPETLRRYLPKAHMTQALTLFNDKNKDNPSQTEELLYKVLFDVQKDLGELKKLVLKILQSDGNIRQEVMNNHKDLFDDITNINAEESTQKQFNKLLIESNLSIDNNVNLINQEDMIINKPEEINGIEQDNIQDIEHEVESENLSIEEKEKELIIKALKKNKNRRKRAAEDLGISERTLYRKIKQYEIEKQ